MQINPISNTQQTNFKGYLKFQNNRLINTKNITSIIYDHPDINMLKEPTFSAAFLMNDGLKYCLKYLTPPVRTLIDNIILASSDFTVIDVDALLFCEKISDKFINYINSSNNHTQNSFKEFIKSQDNK